MDKKLYNAVVDQFGGQEDFDNAAQDVYEHGIDGGFSGWTHYSETMEFFAQNKREILAHAREVAGDFGEDMLEMIASFGCLRDHELTVDEVAEAIYSESQAADVVQNALAWFVAEEAVRQHVEAAE